MKKIIRNFALCAIAITGVLVSCEKDNTVPDNSKPDVEEHGPGTGDLVEPETGDQVEPEINHGQVLFEDNFDWIKEWADLGDGAGDAVGTNNPSTPAYNVATKEGCEGFRAEFEKRGYQDVDNGTNKIMYLQQYYLKFGKTSFNNGLILPALDLAQATDLTFEFDWTPQISGKRDKQDIFDLIVEIQGEGTFENGAKESDPINVTLSKDDSNLFVLAWQHVSLTVSGAAKDTRLIVRPMNMKPEGKFYNRYYLDNLLIKVK